MNKFGYILALCACSAHLISCDPVTNESEIQLYMLATVQQTGYDISLRYDRSTTQAEFSGSPYNFCNEEHLADFGVKPGDHGVAKINYKMSSGVLTDYTLESFMIIDNDHLRADEIEQDTLGTFCHFGYVSLGSMKYENVWNNGHLLISVINYYPDPETPEEENIITTNVKELRNDTLVLLVTADIPNTNYKYTAESTMLQYDLSEIKTIKSMKAAEIANSIDALKADHDSMYVKVETCDSLEIYNDKAYRKLAGYMAVTRVPLDF